MTQQHEERLPARVQSIERLSRDVVRLKLACPALNEYRAGQYVKLFLDPGRTGYYSLASAPSVDASLHLHVQRCPGSGTSRWIHDALEVGAALEISRPMGSCFYLPTDLDQPLLMLGTGSGLAPLYGMVRDALRHGHRGAIHLYHGVRQREDLYLVEPLQALARLHANFRYVPCLSRDAGPEHCRAGRALDVALRDTPLPENWRIYLSGSQDTVHSAFRAFCAAGVPAASILSDQLAPAVAAEPYARAA